MTATLDPGAIANAAALRPADAAELQKRIAAYEAAHVVPQWQPLELHKMTSASGAELQLLGDGSVLVKGAKPATDTYTVVAWTDRTQLTGLRLEALPDDSLPGKGPGRADNGNFVVRLAVTEVPVTEPTAARKLTFPAVSADYAQREFEPMQAITGTGNRGWAVSPQFGRKHEAFFEAKDDFGRPGGTCRAVRRADGPAHRGAARRGPSPHRRHRPRDDGQDPPRCCARPRLGVGQQLVVPVQPLTAGAIRICITASLWRIEACQGVYSGRSSCALASASTSR
jgi:hypothetical protein